MKHILTARQSKTDSKAGDRGNVCLHFQVIPQFRTKNGRGKDLFSMRNQYTNCKQLHKRF